MTWSGGCLCGEVRYEIGVEPMWVGHCHCSMCRKHTGAAVGTYVGFAAGTVRWLGREPARYRSSEDVERSFCPGCGSTIGFHRIHETSLTIGSFDRPDDIVAECQSRSHVFRQEKLDWFDTVDSWARFDQFAPGREGELQSMSGKPIKG
jgi:hypothetical protein